MSGVAAEVPPPFQFFLSFSGLRLAGSHRNNRVHFQFFLSFRVFDVNFTELFEILKTFQFFLSFRGVLSINEHNRRYKLSILFEF